MNSEPIFQLGQISVLDLDGQEAAQILHNLTTNEVKSLVTSPSPDGGVVGSGCESFITDVRGKTLGHVYVYRTEKGFRLIGAAGQSETIASHADKYTIREDAVPTIRDSDFVTIVVDRGLLDVSKISVIPPSLATNGNAGPRGYAGSASDVCVYENHWVGEATVLILVPSEHAVALIQQLASIAAVADEAAFHQARTLAGFPWYGVDLSDKNLPQEADRDESAICFTKGCYLGQETVARLDALGQVQKKLVKWLVEAPMVTELEGTELSDNDKVVGRLTSIAVTGESTAQAIGVARRTHFDPGASAVGAASDGQSVTATVIE